MLITNSKDLQKVCEGVESEEFIAIDTEFMRDRVYYPDLSLIQVATSKHVFAVDMRAGINTDSLAEILKNKSVVKVFHSARQDMEVLGNHFGFVPKNVFDTQIAALFCGFEGSPSYNSLVEHYLDIQLDKKLQYSDWLQRPLEDEQLAYALLDVIHLKEIYPMITAELERQSRMGWVKDECMSLEQNANFYPTAEELLKKFLSSVHRANDLYKMYKLLEWRERKAQAENKPRKFIVWDEQLLNMVETSRIASRIFKKLDASEKEYLLQVLKGGDEWSDEEREVIRRAQSLKRKVRPKKDEFYIELKQLVTQTSAEHGIAESMIATSDDLLTFIMDDENSKLMRGWRREVFGNEALQLKEARK